MDEYDYEEEPEEGNEETGQWDKWRDVDYVLAYRRWGRQGDGKEEWYIWDIAAGRMNLYAKLKIGTTFRPGLIVSMPTNKDGSVRSKMAKVQWDTMPPTDLPVDLWQAEDKANATLRRLSKEVTRQEDFVKEALKPIKDIWGDLSLNQRRAIRLLIMEYLGG